MDGFLLTFIFSSLVGLIGYYYLWFVSRKKRRARALSLRAMHHGYRFIGDINVSQKEKFGPFRLFCIRVAGKMENVIRYRNPWIWIFDYEYLNSES